MYVDDRLGRRGGAARSGLDQLDLAEDLLAVVAAAVAVVVPRSSENLPRSQSAKAKTPQTAGRRPIFSRATASHAL